ncbi:hypothetical protein HNQ49_003848 [Parapusillimonas granuli]|nr:hypothetical protein [Parapusillimonas granuli]
MSLKSIACRDYNPHAGERLFPGARPACFKNEQRFSKG